MRKTGGKDVQESLPGVLWMTRAGIGWLRYVHGMDSGLPGRRRRSSTRRTRHHSGWLRDESDEPGTTTRPASECCGMSDRSSVGHRAARRIIARTALTPDLKWLRPRQRSAGARHNGRGPTHPTRD